MGFGWEIKMKENNLKQGMKSAQIIYIIGHVKKKYVEKFIRREN